MRIFRGKIPRDLAPISTNGCYDNGNATNETLVMSGDIVNTFSDVSTT